jgi:glycosyltransferase involved in cell wall biosynthesis
MKVVHIAAGLDTGGGQTMLYRLVSRTDRELYPTEVVSLTDIGPIGDRIRDLGVPVSAIGMRRGVPSPLAVFRLGRLLRTRSPHAVQTWGYHADLAGGLAARLAGHIPLVWGIHHTTFDAQGSKRLTVWTAWICARLSRWLPDRIVCCSEATRQVHTRLGYAADKMIVITNGFDPDLFRPDAAARQSVRQELGIDANTPLIGLVARFDPQKNHRGFLQAAAILHARLPQCRYLLCGTDITWENSQLVEWIDAAGIRDRCHLLGERSDVPRLMAAVDVVSSAAAFGEAFPLVIGEAMACGVPCVVTDVGDSAIMVGETGVVVPPGDPQALAHGWARLLLSVSAEERRSLGLAARRRVEEQFSLERTVEQYLSVYGAVGRAPTGAAVERHRCGGLT